MAAIGYDGTTFRERYKATGEELDRRLQEHFGMTLREFFRKIEPRPNPAEKDPVFNWHEKKGDEP